MKTEKLEAELVEAERALDASCRAFCTHGFQKITWLLMQADGERVRELRNAIKTSKN